MFSMSNNSNNKLRIEVLVTKPKPNWKFLTKTAFKYVLSKPIGILCCTSKVNVHTEQKLDWNFFLPFDFYHQHYYEVVLQISHSIPRKLSIVYKSSQENKIL